MGFVVRATGGDMHSHDRTMISRLGFADPDKRDADHERACQFLVQPDVASLFSSLVQPREMEFHIESEVQSDHVCPRDAEEHERRMTRFLERRASGILDDFPEPTGPSARKIEASRKAHYAFAGSTFSKGLVEIPINKGEGQYQTTVGFMDVELEFRHIFNLQKIDQTTGRCRSCGTIPVEWRGRSPDRQIRQDKWNIAIEVKIGRVPVSDIIRQILLYKTYFRARSWMLATPWAIGPHEMASLESHRIGHILLGDRFEKFCEEAMVLPVAKSDFVL